MSGHRLPYPVLAAAWAAGGVYLLPQIPWYLVLVIAACGVTLSVLSHRSAIAVLACCVGIWAGQVAEISSLQQYTSLSIDNVTEIRGRVLTDSRQAQSGNYWFRIHVTEVLDSQGQGGKADLRIAVLGSFDPLVNYGQRISLKGNFSDESWFRLTEISDRTQGNILNDARSGLRRRFRQELRLISTASAGLAEALLMGSTDSIDPEMHALFRSNGLLHVLALSGMHLGILIAAPCMILRKLFGLKTAVILGNICMLMLLYFIGLRSSLLRAGLFFAISSIWLLNGRKPQALVILSQCFLLLLLMFPGLLHEIGFQLSFSAVAGILVIAPPVLSYMNSFFPRTGRLFYGPIAAGFAASAAGLPIAAAAWGVWYPAGILLTLLVVPAVSLLMYSCIILVIAYTGLLPAFLVVFLEQLIYYTSNLLRFMLQMSSGMFEVRLEGSSGHILVFSVLLLCAILTIRWYQQRRRLCEESCITVN
ncbi:ComEC/Rec2 family competence protein [Spirochaeta dissipatitropha]